MFVYVLKSRYIKKITLSYFLLELLCLNKLLINQINCFLENQLTAVLRYTIIFKHYLYKIELAYIY